MQYHEIVLQLSMYKWYLNISLKINENNVRIPMKFRLHYTIVLEYIILLTAEVLFCLIYEKYLSSSRNTQDDLVVITAIVEV